MLARVKERYTAAQASEQQLEVLGKLGIATKEDITAVEARNVIREGFKTTSIGPIQRMILMRTVTLDELQQILKRKVDFIDDISVSDYQRVMKMKNNPESMFIRSVNHPLKTKRSWEYGWQETNMCANGRFYYLLSYDICMFDLDDDVETRDESGQIEASQTLTTHTISKIESVSDKLGLTFRVYKTPNGYHVHTTSERIHHRDPRVKDITSELGSDIQYLTFSINCGFKTRLNKKLGRDNDFISSYLGTYGEKKEDPKILKYLSLHDRLVEHHRVSEEEYRF